MVTESLINAVTALFVWIIQGIPAPAPPAFFADAVDAVNLVASFAGSLAYWQALEVIVPIVAAWFVMWGLGVGVKIVRMFASIITGGGGSAA